MSDRLSYLTPETIELFQPVRLLATDMDGTLTRNGQFTPALLRAFEDLARAGISVVIVTGRSAGWVQAVAHYLPVTGAIAENGGVLYWGTRAGEAGEWLSSIAEVQLHRQKLQQMFQVLQQEFPKIQESSDNLFRLTDWTFDVEGFSPEELEQMSDRCQEHGFGFTYSTVQCHIKPLEQDKAIGLMRVLQQKFPDLAPNQVVTVGDSPNDESLFDNRYFPLSVGVANIQDYADRLTHQPAYITQSPEADGFCELATWMLSAVDAATR
jgi:HAD superfamily hydrolase (TIGR01484 family)